MKKVLVTGATGLVGKKLIPALIKKNDQVVAFVLPDDSQVTSLSVQNIEIKFGDIRNLSSVEKAVRGCQAVINLAAVQESGNHRLNYAINYQGVKNLIKACRKHTISRFIHLSSIATVYKKKSYYGQSKEKADRYIMSCPGIDYTILRPTLIYGSPVPGPFHTFLKTIDKIPFVIPIIGDGKALKQPVYVDDVVRAIVLVLGSKKAIGKFYDVSGKDKISVGQMVDMVAAKKKIRKLKIKIPARILSPLALILERILPNPPLTRASVITASEDAILDHTLITKELGFRPLSFQQGLAKINF